MAGGLADFRVFDLGVFGVVCLAGVVGGVFWAYLRF